MVDPVRHKETGSRPVTRVLQAPATAAPTAVDRPPVRQADLPAASSLAAQLAAKPPVDAERVSQIRKAIANGTFPILPATIADRMLALRYDWMADEQA